MARRKPYGKMSFGELLVAGLGEASAIARGEMKPAKVTRIAIPTARLLPTHRPPTHPGEMLLEEFLKPLELSRAEFARKIGVPAPQIYRLESGRAGVTVLMALRLSRVFSMSPEFWLNLQHDWDLWHALRSPEAKRIAKLRPLHHPNDNEGGRRPPRRR